MEINDKHIEIIVSQMLRKVRVESTGDGAHLVQRVLVADRVHPVPQRDVLEVEGGAHDVAAISVSASASAWVWWVATMRSATWRAADVMMSRLPA